MMVRWTVSVFPFMKSRYWSEWPWTSANVHIPLDENVEASESHDLFFCGGGGGANLGTSKGRQQLLPKFLRLPWCLWPGASYFFSLGLFSYLKNGWSLWRVICSSRSDFLWQIQYWKTRVCRIRGVLLLCNRGGTEFRDNRVVFMLPSVAPRTLTSSLSLPWEDKNVGGGAASLPGTHPYPNPSTSLISLFWPLPVCFTLSNKSMLIP